MVEDLLGELDLSLSGDDRNEELVSPEYSTCWRELCLDDAFNFVDEFSSFFLLIDVFSTSSTPIERLTTSRNDMVGCESVGVASVVEAGGSHQRKRGNFLSL